MIVVISEEVVADLKEIGDFIAREHPWQAVSFVNELLDRCERPAEMPKAFQLVPRYEQLGSRRRPHGQYLIFCSIDVEIVELLHILNGAQDYESVLFAGGYVPSPPRVAASGQ